MLRKYRLEHFQRVVAKASCGQSKLWPSELHVASCGQSELHVASCGQSKLWGQAAIKEASKQPNKQASWLLLAASYQAKNNSLHKASGDSFLRFLGLAPKIACKKSLDGHFKSFCALLHKELSGSLYRPTVTFLRFENDSQVASTSSF